MLMAELVAGPGLCGAAVPIDPYSSAAMPGQQRRETQNPIPTNQPSI